MLTMVLTACPAEKPSFDERDPLIQKLKAERAKPTPPAETALEKLANAATAPAPPVKHDVLKAPQVVGDFELVVTALETMSTVGSEKISLSTDERFVRLRLDLTPKKAASLRVREWVLRQGATTYPVAIDAQRVAQGTPLAAELQANTTQTIVAYFELPLDAVRPGLELVMAPSLVVRVQ